MNDAGEKLSKLYAVGVNELASGQGLGQMQYV